MAGSTEVTNFHTTALDSDLLQFIKGPDGTWMQDNHTAQHELPCPKDSCLPPGLQARKRAMQDVDEWETQAPREPFPTGLLGTYLRNRMRLALEAGQPITSQVVDQALRDAVNEGCPELASAARLVSPPGASTRIASRPDVAVSQLKFPPELKHVGVGTVSWHSRGPSGDNATWARYDLGISCRAPQSCPASWQKAGSRWRPENSKVSSACFCMQLRLCISASTLTLT